MILLFLFVDTFSQAKINGGICRYFRFKIISMVFVLNAMLDKYISVITLLQKQHYL